MNVETTDVGSDDDLQADIDKYANMSPQDVRAELDAAGIDPDETVRAITEMIEQWRRRRHHQAKRVNTNAARLRIACASIATGLINRIFNLLREIRNFARQVTAV